MTRANAPSPDEDVTFHVFVGTGPVPAVWAGAVPVPLAVELPLGMRPTLDAFVLERGRGRYDVYIDMSNVASLCARRAIDKLICARLLQEDRSDGRADN